MQDLLSRLSELNRPRLLVRAARIGADNYKRTPHLHRLLGYISPHRTGPALVRLMEMERDLNDQRKMADASYSVSHHVEVLMAMIGEARLLQNTN